MISYASVQQPMQLYYSLLSCTASHEIVLWPMQPFHILYSCIESCTGPYAVALSAILLGKLSYALI